MSLDDKLIEELKIQSERDLKEAENILNNHGYIEHVAWYCEQSYEKLVKSIYAHFKLKIQHGNVKSVYEKIYEKQHYESYKLIINMFREIQAAFRQSLDNATAKIKTKSPEMPEFTINAMSSFIGSANIPSVNRKLENKISEIDSKIAREISSVHAFKDFLSNSTELSLMKSIHSSDIDDLTKKALNQLSKDLKFKSDDPLFTMVLKSAFSSNEKYLKFYGFISQALVLARWILPHTSMSRYPILDYDFENLKPYRQRETELKAFFTVLIDEIRKLYPTSKDFIDILQYYKDQDLIS